MNDEIVMNGPATFEMKVWVVNDDTGHSGQVTIGLGAFDYPTKEFIENRMNQVIQQLEEQGMLGFRLMTKREAFEAWSLETIGERMALAGSADWDAI